VHLTGITAAAQGRAVTRILTHEPIAQSATWRRLSPLRPTIIRAGFDVGTVKQGSYDFSGGDSLRDYATLLQAVSGPDEKVVIATRLAQPRSLVIRLACS
jgi:hypothetical protein